MRNQSARSIRNILNHINQENFHEQTAIQIKSRLAHLKGQWKNFAAKNAKLIEKTPKKHEQKKCWSLYDEIETDYISARASLNTRLKELKDIQIENINDEPIEQTENELNKEQIEQNHIQEEIPNQMGNQIIQPGLWQFPSWKAIEKTWGDFDGTLSKWQGFHDRFKQAVHDNELIPRAFKFQHLQNSLKGKALTALGEWQLSDDNYNEAWERLNELYAREYQTGKELLWKFFDLPKLERASAYMIQKYSNVTHEVLRQLRSLHYPVEHYDLIFVHSIHDKLDSETSKAWELRRESERPSIDEMLKFLDVQAKALMGVQFVESRGTINEKKKSFSTFERKDKVKSFSREKGETPKLKEEKSVEQSKCKVCNEDKHWLYKCDKFKKMNVPERKRVVREHELCNNCLKPFHKSKECFAKACARCDIKHNSLLCPENPLNKVVTNAQFKQDNDGSKNTKPEQEKKKRANKRSAHQNQSEA